MCAEATVRIQVFRRGCVDRVLGCSTGGCETLEVLCVGRAGSMADAGYTQYLATWQLGDASCKHPGQRSTALDPTVCVYMPGVVAASTVVHR
jgi:hypothetical protein